MYFGIKGADIADMPFGEIEEYLDALHALSKR